VRPAFCGRQDRALWQSGGETEKDSIAVVEVMVVEIGGSYWHSRAKGWSGSFARMKSSSALKKSGGCDG
jgi:hypothetical protein